MLSVVKYLLFLHRKQKQILRFALHLTVRGFAQDDMNGAFFRSLMKATRTTDSGGRGKFRSLR